VTVGKSLQDTVDSAVFDIELGNDSIDMQTGVVIVEPAEHIFFYNGEPKSRTWALILTIKMIIEIKNLTPTPHRFQTDFDDDFDDDDVWELHDDIFDIKVHILCTCSMYM